MVTGIRANDPRLRSWNAVTSSGGSSSLFVNDLERAFRKESSRLYLEFCREGQVSIPKRDVRQSKVSPVAALRSALKAQEAKYEELHDISRGVVEFRDVGALS